MIWFHHHQFYPHHGHYFLIVRNTTSCISISICSQTELHVYKSLAADRTFRIGLCKWFFPACVQGEEPKREIIVTCIALCGTMAALTEISFSHSLLLSRRIVLQFCKDYGSITFVLRANSQNDFSTEMDVLVEWDLGLKSISGVYPILQLLFENKIVVIQCLSMGVLSIHDKS